MRRNVRTRLLRDQSVGHGVQVARPTRWRWQGRAAVRRQSKRRSKTRTIQGEFAEEERRVLEAASKQLAAKGSGGGKVGSSGRSGGRGVT